MRRGEDPNLVKVYEFRRPSNPIPIRSKLTYKKGNSLSPVDKVQVITSFTKSSNYREPMYFKSRQIHKTHMSSEK